MMHLLVIKMSPISSEVMMICEEEEEEEAVVEYDEDVMAVELLHMDLIFSSSSS